MTHNSEFTYSEWKFAIPNEFWGLLNKRIHNPDQIYGHNPISFHVLISHGMHWSGTPEGFHFWSDVAKINFNSVHEFRLKLRNHLLTFNKPKKIELKW